MIAGGLKALIIPGSIAFFIISLLPGVLLLFRRKDGGRAGKIWVTVLVLTYWILSTPLAAIGFVNLATPHVPPIGSKADARGAAAIVVLGAGMEIHRSRGASYGAPNRDASLRVLEAARLHGLLGVPIVTTGGWGSQQYSEAGMMARQLEQLGVPADRIIKEEKSMNTRDHAILVPPILKQHGIDRFVLVTSRQHIRRALAAFRAVGLHPVPSTPEVYVARGDRFEMYLPSRVALQVSEWMMYDLIGWVYYKARGWI